MTALTMSKTELRERARRLVMHKRRPVTGNHGGFSRRKALLSSARLMAAEVHKRYSGISIYLFGSLVSAERWREADSDVDIAVVGINGADYWQIWKLAEGMLPECKLDLVDLEMATPGFRHAVESTGVKL